jgi:hypothetical protein
MFKYKNLTTLANLVLVICGCEQAWIDKNKQLINAIVSSIAYGIYYYGSVGSCDLDQREHKNRFVNVSTSNSLIKHIIY